MFKGRSPSLGVTKVEARSHWGNFISLHSNKRFFLSILISNIVYD